MSDKPWRARASSVAAYYACELRAWFDRSIREGRIADFGDHTSSSYADLGTLIHAQLMRSMGCVIPEGDPNADALFLANASTLFKGDAAATIRAIEASAALAKLHFPAAADGRPWLAEQAFDMGYLTGHLDFLSRSGDEILDLKTTSRKPDHNRIKAPHLIQLCVYYLISGRTAKTGRILYADSMQAKWAILSDVVEFANPLIQELINDIDLMTKRWNEGAMESWAKPAPRIGSNCDGDFCPYRAGCRDKIIPPGTEVLLSTVTTRPRAAPFVLGAA